MAYPRGVLLERRNAVHVLLICVLSGALVYLHIAVLRFQEGLLLLMIALAAVVGLTVTQPAGRRLFMSLLLLAAACIAAGITGTALGY
jgi:hypothetical protein